MLNIVLIGDKNFSLKDIENVNHIGAKNTYYSNDLSEYIVEYSDILYTDLPGFPKGVRTAMPIDHLSYSYFTYDDELIKLDFPEENLRILSFKAEVFIYLSFSYISTMKAVLRQADFPKNIYIDDDFGHILPLQEFNKLEWDYSKGNIPPKN